MPWSGKSDQGLGWCYQGHGKSIKVPFHKDLRKGSTIPNISRGNQ